MLFSLLRCVILGIDLWRFERGLEREGHQSGDLHSLFGLDWFQVIVSPATRLLCRLCKLALALKASGGYSRRDEVGGAM